jgi:hypothetical protein
VVIIAAVCAVDAQIRVIRASHPKQNHEHLIVPISIISILRSPSIFSLTLHLRVGDSP